MTFNLINPQNLEVASAFHGHDLHLSQLLFFHIGYCKIHYIAGSNLEIFLPGTEGSAKKFNGPATEKYSVQSK
jgi:hypothetical protein